MNTTNNMRGWRDTWLCGLCSSKRSRHSHKHIQQKNIRRDFSPSARTLPALEQPVAGIDSPRLLSHVQGVYKPFNDEVPPVETPFVDIQPVKVLSAEEIAAQAIVETPSLELLEILERTMEYLVTRHVLGWTLEEIGALHLLEVWLNVILDPHHTMLTRKDVDWVLTRLNELIPSLRNRDFKPIYEIFEVYKQRTVDRITVAKNFLNENICATFTSEEFFSVDRRHAPWPKHQEDARKIWISLIKAALLEAKLNNSSTSESSEIAKEKVIQQLDKMLAQLLEKSRAIHTIMYALPKSYDLKSFFTHPEKAELIGTLTINNNIIKSIEGENPWKPIQSKVIEFQEKHFGWICIPYFYQDVATKILTLLETFMNDKNIDGLIIDLSNNQGGYIKVSDSMVAFLVPEESIGQQKGRNGVISLIRSTPKNMARKPIIILVNGESASAAERVIGMLASYHVGAIVGIHPLTSGKGTTLVRFKVGSGFELNITVTVFYFINGKSPQLTGFAPHIILLRNRNYQPKNASPFNKLTADKILPVDSHPDCDEFSFNKLLDFLDKNSARRVAENPQFQALQTAQERLNNGFLISLNEQQRIEEHKSERALRDIKELVVPEVSHIMYDIIQYLEKD